MCSVFLAGTASAEIHDYYVGVDTLDEVTFGTYLGLSNPNQGRLTFLFAHPNDESPESSHFHGIGVHTYEGPVESATETTTNGNNRLPETYTGQAPLTLQPGVEDFAGKLVSGENGEHFSDLSLHSIHDLAGFEADATETYLYDSSDMGYQGSLDGMNLGLSIVSMTPGLKLGSGGLLSGDTLAIGSESNLPLEPVFWTEADASPGTYSAELQLVDLDGNLLPSGTFHIDFAVTSVPEPSTLGLVGAILGVVAVVSCRRA